MKKGFTLVEMVVVMGVLTFVGLTVLTIFGKTLQGGNRSQVVEIVKQNGSSVLETIDKTARNAENVVCPTKNDACLTSPPCKTLAVRNGNGTYTRFRFIDPVVSPPTNGVLKQDTPIKQNFAGASPPREETDPEFVIRICDPNDPLLPDVASLTDTNITTGVSAENSSFSKDSSAGFKDQITIKFNLKPGVSSPSLNQVPAQTFQTTIELR